MQKKVPFKKDIPFDTNIAEITSISLEHEVLDKSDNLVAGKFILSGDYKMTEASINLDTFEYELPFNINIDKKYIIDESEIDISDFYYEVVNNRILSVNIELTIDNIEEKEEEIMNTEDSTFNEPVEEKIDSESEVDTSDERNVESVKSIFNNLDETDEYVTYKIHIVTENDTIESIINDYGVSRDDIINYNDLTEIKIGDKIIIPANES